MSSYDEIVMNNITLCSSLSYPGRHAGILRMPRKDFNLLSSWIQVGIKLGLWRVRGFHDLATIMLELMLELMLAANTVSENG